MPSLQSSAHDGSALSASSLKALTVQIVGHTRPNASFEISMPDLKQREDEMKQTAQQFQIPASRWKASRLYQASRLSSNGLVEFDPERDIVLQNYSFSMDWQPWLTTLLSQYYQSGKLNVPDQCQGSDLLLALEYFGILYAPGQLVFATHAAYQRVRCWSDYLTHRTAIADSVAEKVQQTQASVKDPQELMDQVLFFGTVLHSRETVEAGGRKIASWGADKEDSVCAVIHHLFNTSDENRVAESLREDFCVYLQNLLVDEIKVTFAVKWVDIASSQRRTQAIKMQRAILKVEFVFWTIEEEPTYQVGSTEQRVEGSTHQPTTRNGVQQEESLKPGRVNNKRRSISDGSPVDVTKDIYVGSQRGGKKDPLTIFTPSTMQKGQLTAKAATPQSKPIVDETDDDFYKSGIATGARLPSKDLDPRKAMHGANPGRPRSIDIVFASSATGWNAPVDVIDPSRLENQTVASAITGPVFPSDESFSIDTAGVRAQALRHEWVQGSLLNRDISTHMRELLDIDEKAEGVNGEVDDGDLLYSNKKKLELSREEEKQLEHSLKDSQDSRQDKNIGDTVSYSWDWISTVCQGGSVCEYGHESPERRRFDRNEQTTTKSSKSATHSKSNSKTTPRKRETKGHSMPPSNENNQNRSAENRKQRVLPPKRRSSGTLVKDRLKKVEEYQWKVEKPSKRKDIDRSESKEKQAHRQRHTESAKECAAGDAGETVPANSASTKQNDPTIHKRDAPLQIQRRANPQKPQCDPSPRHRSGPPSNRRPVPAPGGVDSPSNNLKKDAKLGLFRRRKS